MKLIFEFMKPYRRLMAFVLIVMMLDVAGGLLIPTITADIINHGIGGGSLTYILQQGLFMIAVSLLTSFGALAGSYLGASLSAKLGRDIRNALYDKTLSFSASDMDRFGTGSMITRTLSDVNIVQQSVIMVVQMILPVPVVCILGIVMAFRIDVMMGWILTGVTLAILFMAFCVIKKAAPLFQRLQRFLDRMNIVIRENITGVRVIRAFNKELFEEKRMSRVFGDYREVSVKVNRLFAGLESTALLVINLVIVGILYVGGNRTGAGFMKIGDIIALSEYAILILFYLIMAQMVMVMLPRALICIGRIQDVLDLEPEIKDGNYSEQPIKTEGTDVIRFENVSFCFSDAGENTLSELNFICKRGQTTAIIGSTGSGKSTIAKLILRFHDVSQGAIKLNEMNIRDMEQFHLREHISYVPQKAWLFSGTIANNLLYGNKDASEEEMHHILSVAQADFVTELSGGLLAHVAQGGTNFSGGQKQRLSIARALMKKADLYIFDDSFSALDFKTDAALRKALKNQTKDSAVLIIAQRISTIMNADQIIVLENGKIAGIGTHQSLMEECPVYQDIAKSQMKGEVARG
ncbi:ABC transporter ATP-binding protein [Anaerotignum propionicum]|uniref:ABC transporter ATP-binding protein n=1 Tax=Anaerotignum propionicum TaxID=28446 RepID=UPI0028A0C1DE|nr:ABC transporter ATP-binding protein [Anaerotignum propionicum]